MQVVTSPVINRVVNPDAIITSGIGPGAVMIGNSITVPPPPPPKPIVKEEVKKQEIPIIPLLVAVGSLVALWLLVKK